MALVDLDDSVITSFWRKERRRQWRVRAVGLKPLRARQLAGTVLSWLDPLMIRCRVFAVHVWLAVSLFACSQGAPAPSAIDAGQPNNAADAGASSRTDAEVPGDAARPKPSDAGADESATPTTNNPESVEIRKLTLPVSAELRGQVVIEVEASATGGEVEGVRLFVAGELVASADRAPFRLFWNTCDMRDGDYVIEAEAFAGTRVSARVTAMVRVANSQEAPNLSARAVETRAYLSWTHCGATQGFRVFWSVNAGVDERASSLRSDRVSLLHDMNSATQYYRVAALTDGELGPLSNEVKVASVSAEPRVCSADGWCWDWGPPQSLQLRSVWGVSDSEVFAGGPFRLLRRGAGRWLFEDTSDAFVVITDLWGASATSLWAAGDSGLWHWDGHWQRAQGVPDRPFNAVWGVGDHDVWAVGWEGAFHWDGTTWQKLPTPTVVSNYRFNDVWASGPDDVWVAGFTDGPDKGSILHFDGKSWTVSVSGLPELAAVWGAAPGEVWTVSRSGTIHHLRAKRWTAVDGGTIEFLSGLHGCSADNVWAVGANGTVLHWDGQRWQDRSPGVTTLFNSVWCENAQRAWVVGERGEMLHWDDGWSVPAAQHVGPLRSLVNTSQGPLAVGENNTVLRRGSRGWQREQGGFTDRYPNVEIYDMHATMSDDIWAVGAQGAVVHWDGESWRAFDPITCHALHAVWAVSPQDVWAAGDEAAILHFDGVRWRAHDVGRTAIINDLWGTAKNDVWAAGWDGLSHWNGESWSSAPGNTTTNMKSVWGASASDIWGTSSGDLVKHWDGHTWSNSQLGVGVKSSLGAVHGSSANDVWMSASSYYLHYDGKQWQRQDWSEFTNPLGLSVGSSRDVWLVGGHETRHWDGLNWTQHAPDTVQTQSGVFRVDNTVYSFGAAGTISTWDGQAWSRAMPLGTTPEHLGDVWVESTDRLWVVGDHGTIRHWDGTRWDEHASGTLAPLFAIAGAGPTDIWAGGEAGTLLHYDGQRWQAVNSATNLTIRDLWVASSDHVLAVAGDFQDGWIQYNATVLRWDGMSWQTEQTPNVPTLVGVWGSAANNVWAVGHETILHWDGSAWTPSQFPLAGTPVVWGVWGRNDHDVWAVGEGGLIVHWDGNAWTKQRSPGAVTLRQVIGTSEGIWAVGDDGAILRHDP